MFNYIKTGDCFISDTTIGYPPYLSLVFEVLCIVRYKHCEMNAGIEYSYARVFIEVLNHLILPTDQSKSQKKR